MQLRNKTFLLIGTMLLVIGLQQCQLVSPSVRVDPESKPFEKLSDYGFFIGSISNLEPNERVLPFEPITPLFSDYALKYRFVWMPIGTSAVYNDNGTFDFPVGAVLIKNFSFPVSFLDQSLGREIIETRLFVLRKDGWDALPYVWNEEQTEAYLEIAGQIKDVSWVDKKGNEINTHYVIPNKNQCKGCHAKDGRMLPIGPKAKNLNSLYSYSGNQMNQLDKWSVEGFLTGFNDDGLAPKIAKWDDPVTGTLEERALAYLEINCGTCHNREGSAHTTGLYLTTDESNPTHLGICKSPVAAGRGTGGFKYDVDPGRSDQSILVYRMESTDPGVMMPEMGRVLVHVEGVELISEWINSLTNSCSTPIIKN